MNSLMARIVGRRALSSVGNGGANILRDEADWIYSGEWWGSQDGGFGRNEGQTVFQKHSLKGNGLVSVTAHPASIPVSMPTLSSVSNFLIASQVVKENPVLLRIYEAQRNTSWKRKSIWSKRLGRNVEGNPEYKVENGVMVTENGPLIGHHMTTSYEKNASNGEELDVVSKGHGEEMQGVFVGFFGLHNMFDLFAGPNEEEREIEEMFLQTLETNEGKIVEEEECHS
ncbi:hypothetical protein KI387_023937 [Taxus chinensis]|uniref:Uncharacterized protein n=1 Tax=Taxus chinensis TaxID=29808 RepID=A0AA38G4G4_TAXCH|nr:hypothetical protein KI387_023937 [Taxus chinensis]